MWIIASDGQSAVNEQTPARLSVNQVGTKFEIDHWCFKHESKTSLRSYPTKEEAIKALVKFCMYPRSDFFYHDENTPPPPPESDAPIPRRRRDQR